MVVCAARGERGFVIPGPDWSVSHLRSGATGGLVARVDCSDCTAGPGAQMWLARSGKLPAPFRCQMRARYSRSVEVKVTWTLSLYLARAAAAVARCQRTHPTGGKAILGLDPLPPPTPAYASAARHSRRGGNSQSTLRQAAADPRQTVGFTTTWHGIAGGLQLTPQLPPRLAPLPV